MQDNSMVKLGEIAALCAKHDKEISDLKKTKPIVIANSNSDASSKEMASCVANIAGLQKQVAQHDTTIENRLKTAADQLQLIESRSKMLEQNIATKQAQTEARLAKLEQQIAVMHKSTKSTDSTSGVLPPVATPVAAAAKK
jgi:septal ring factor EnvC (AmiA/AmiB activator)